MRGERRWVIKGDFRPLPVFFLPSSPSCLFPPLPLSSSFSFSLFLLPSFSSSSFSVLLLLLLLLLLLFLSSSSPSPSALLPFLPSSLFLTSSPPSPPPPLPSPSSLLASFSPYYVSFFPISGLVVDSGVLFFVGLSIHILGYAMTDGPSPGWNSPTLALWWQVSRRR